MRGVSEPLTSLPPAKRAKVLTPEAEMANFLKSLSNEDLRNYWEKIDWQKIQTLQLPVQSKYPTTRRQPSLIDDTEFVKNLDVRMRAGLSQRISDQIPPLTSLAKQEAKLAAMFND